MRRLFALAGIAGLFLCLCCQRQEFDVERFIRENPLRCASNLHCYEVLDSSVTPAPRGYAPFYISHISRHGSRGHCELETFDYVDTLRLLEQQGLLTPQAVEITRTLEAIRRANTVVGAGVLTDRGHWEHREIARRMGENYPEVFSDSLRANVQSYSTGVHRVLDSRESFLEQLNAMFPHLKMEKSLSKDSPRAHDEVGLFKLSKEQDRELDNVHTTPFCDSIRLSIDYTRLIKKTFVPGKMPEGHSFKAHIFFHRLFYAGMIRQCFMTDTLGWTEPYFSEDEQFTFWKALNASHCKKWGWVAENKGYKARAAYSILGSIIRDADAVIAGADTCATLRFSHDSAVYPLMCLIGLEGCDFRGSFRQISEHNSMSYAMHMAGNLQFVFFRNGAGDTLVKILLNEEEVVIPALTPDRKGLFYKWDRLKTYFESLEQ